MTGDTLTVFLILAATIALFVSDRVRLDLVALMSASALVLTGVLTPNQALAGFSDSLVITIAGLFVVSGALFQTGVAVRLGTWLGRVAGSSQTRLTLLVMAVTALLSGVMSSTGTVAVMLPVVVTLAWRAKISPSKLLIPLAFASLLGGMLTLIGTPPNIVVSEYLAGQGLTPFGFYAFTPVGGVMVAVGALFMVVVGRRWLPSRAPAEGAGGDATRIDAGELAERYELRAHVFRMRVPDDHPLVGATLGELRWPERFRVQVLAVDVDPAAVRAHHRSRRDLDHSKPLAAGTTLEHDDRLLLHGHAAAVAELAAAVGLVAEPVDPTVLPGNLCVVEVLPPPRSRWLGPTLRELAFRERFGVQVVAVQRGGATITEGLAELRLRFGDTVLMQGPRAAIERLKRERGDAVVLAEPDAGSVSARAARRAPVAIAVMIAMLVVMTAGWLPTVLAVGLAAIAMIVTGCLSMEEAYRTINWQSIVLIAGILPMATALQVTGGMQLVVDALVAAVGPYGPMALLAGLFLLTSLASQVISNTATAVLLTPIAFQAGLDLGVSPYPLLMGVAIAASTAFATPVASPVNTLVLSAGQYRFGDFLRVGVALQLLVLVATLLVVPLLFPW
ncbi:MAG: SLC13 family permease [Trueperaceae bacterium]|nr:SLC13 family permease [Trueperaceae bacterium]